MKFRDAVEQTKFFQKFYRQGLQALRAEDKKHVEAQDARKITGSVDMDQALTETLPQSPRWDFAIGYRQKSGIGEKVYFLEIHPAETGELKAMIEKVKFLTDWMPQRAQVLWSMPKEIHWVASGDLDIRKNERRLKELAELGVKYPKKKLTLL